MHTALGGIQLHFSACCPVFASNLLQPQHSLGQHSVATGPPAILQNAYSCPSCCQRLLGTLIISTAQLRRALALYFLFITIPYANKLYGDLPCTDSIFSILAHRYQHFSRQFSRAFWLVSIRPVTTSTGGVAPFDSTSPPRSASPYLAKLSTTSHHYRNGVLFIERRWRSLSSWKENWRGFFRCHL